MATRGTGSEATMTHPVDRAQQWDAATQQRANAAERRLDPKGGRGDPNKTYDKPTPRWGLPGQAKGAIYALDPNDYSRGDVLLFSRYPEELNQRMEAVLAGGGGPGRAYPHFQQLGSKGVQLSVELWFCDAFMWSAAPRLNSKDNAREIAARQAHPNVRVPSLDTRPLGTLAEQARRFLEFYVVGHDGTGMSLPVADLFLHWGGAPRPIPIVLKSADLRLAQFTSPGDPLEQTRGGAGVPQEVTARLEMEVNFPVRMVNPFRPAQPKPGGGKRSSKVGCTVSGFTSDMTRVIQSAIRGTPFDELSLRTALMAATGSPVAGFGPPRQGGVGQ